MEKLFRVMQLGMSPLASVLNIGLKIMVMAVLITVAVCAAIFAGMLNGGRGR